MPSLPTRPMMMSSPARPWMTSSPVEPTRKSLPAVPWKVTAVAEAARMSERAATSVATLRVDRRIGLVVLLPAPGEHMAGGAHEDLRVRPQRPVGDVEVVDRDHLAQRDPRRAEHLPVAGHARLEVQALAVAHLDAAVLVLDQRPRPDEAHL